MNHYILIAFLLVICVLIGTYIYKLDTQNITPIISENNQININPTLDSIPSNIDTITTDNKGNIHIFKDDKYWKLIDGQIDQNNAGVNSKKVWNFPENWNNVDIAIWDNENNHFVFIKNNQAYPFRNGILGSPFPLNEYWKGLNYNDKDFSQIMYIDNKIYFIKKDNYFEYNLDTKKKTKKQDLKHKLNGLEFDKIDGIFINRNDHILGNPTGTINIVKSDKYYRYDPIEEKIEFPGRYFNSGIVNTNYIEYNFNSMGKNGIFIPKKSDNIKYKDKVVSIENGIQSWIVPRDSNYRIVCVGSGKSNGGFGGKVFNDLKLKKGDRVDVIVGQSGTTLPIANFHNDKKLNKTGSSSGSGGSYVWVNNNLVMVAGGGGGWSSEIHPSPNSANSLLYNENAVPSNAKVHIPIKRICITCENSNNSSKIILNDIKTGNDFSRIDITEKPKIDDTNTKKFLGETEYSLTPPIIQIDFEHYLLDYSIHLDYDILSNNQKTNVIDIIKVYDTDGEVYNIYNFNKKYNGEPITAELLLSEKLGYIPKCVERNSQLIDDHIAKSGGNIEDAKNSTNLKNKSIIQINDKNTLVLNGGFGGGGAVTCDKTNLNISNCGGGGGFMGGNSGVVNINEDINGNKYDYKTINDRVIEIDKGDRNKVRVKIPFVSGSGGSSFVAPSNIDKSLVKEKEYQSNWVSNFNSSNGYVTIILLKNLHKKVDKSHNEEYISKTYNVIKNKALENPIDGNVELNLADTILSGDNNDSITSISTIDNGYNIQNMGLVVKPKDIDTSSCSTMANVVINPSLYDEKMINRNTNPIVDKSFYKASSIKGICEESITVVKFPISNRVNLRNMKLNIDLHSDENVDFSGMFHYLFIKENSILRYMSYLNRPEEDIIPDNLLSFNISRERCRNMKTKIELYEEMTKLNISGFSNNYNWEEIKNTISTNMKKYPKYLENEPNFNLVFDNTKHEDKIFETSGNYKANIKTKWNSVEPGFLYILLKNNNANPDVYYNISFIEYDINGVSTFDYLKLLEIENISAGKPDIDTIKKKRNYMNYEINKQIEDIMKT
jgi:hypothetical protein